MSPDRVRLGVAGGAGAGPTGREPLDRAKPSGIPTSTWPPAPGAASGIGPVEDPRRMVSTLSEAVAAVRAGKVCVVAAYDPAAATGIMQRALR